MTMKVLDKPVILINFKTDKRSSGANALALAERIEHVQDTFPEYRIILAVQTQDIYRVRQRTNLSIFAQHIDPVYYGGGTGSICAEAIKDAGASGTILNHPEKKLSRNVIGKTIEVLNNLGMEVILCSSGIHDAIELSEFNPDYIGIEVEKLIGKSYSLSEEYPDFVEEAMSSIHIRLLFGAGIRKRQDVVQVLDKGGAGVMLSSSVIKTEEPGEVLKGLLI